MQENERLTTSRAKFPEEEVRGCTQELEEITPLL